jgi:hypothetical protein
MAEVAEVNYRGVLASGDDISDKYPQDHSRDIYKYRILGTVPFTAMMDMHEKTPMTDVFLNFEEEPYVRSRGPLTGAYTDSTLSTLYTSGGVVDTMLFLKGAQADLIRVRNLDNLVIHDLSNDTFCGCRVVANPVLSGADSYLTVKLTQIDTDAVFAADTPNISYTLMNDARPEGAKLPVGISTDLVPRTNITQIFSEAWECTESQRHRAQYYSESEEARQLANMRMRWAQKQEWSYLFGVQQSFTDPVTGNPVRKLQGVITEMQKRIGLNTLDDRIYRFKTDAEFSGQSWRTGGYNWLKKIVRETSTFDTGVFTKKLFCGNELWEHIVSCVEDRTHWEWKVVDYKYGYKVKVLQGLLKDVEIWQHPLMSENPAYRRAGFLTEDGLCKLRPYRAVKEIKGGVINENDGNVFEDQTKWGMLYEGSMEWHCLENQALIYCADLNTV